MKNLGSVPWTLTHVETNEHINEGQWHHIAGVYDGDEMRLYVDGVLDASMIAWGEMYCDNSPVRIGEETPDLDCGWNGLIDDVRIYNYALSEEQIKALYEGKEPSRKKESED